MTAQIQNLIQQAARWQHLPTIAIRIPAAFRDRLLAIAHAWDDGTELPLFGEIDVESMSIAQLESLMPQIQAALQTKREALTDRRLEVAMQYLSSLCDGAATEDCKGFSGCDSAYGKRLAKYTASWSLHQAKAAFSLIQKYRRTQLSPAGFELPDSFDTIAHQYSGTKPPQDEKRIVKEGSKIVFYTPYDKSDDWAAPAVIPRVKELGGKFDGDTKGWGFSFAAAEALVEVFGAVFDVSAGVFDAIAEYKEVQAQKQAETQALQAQKEIEAQAHASELQQLIDLAQLDASLPNGRIPFKHQKEAATWLIGQTFKGYRGGILADQMGLGKTMSALLAAKAIVAKYEIPVFVVCPASLKDNWLREAEGVGVGIEVFSWAKLPEALEHGKFLLIWDESHYAQSGDKSQRGKKFLELNAHPNCHAAWLLTGTPMKNGAPINLLPLLQAANHELARGEDAKWSYFRRYCNAHKKSVGGGRSVWDFSGSAHLAELAKATESVILRRTKKECLDLPDKIRAMKPVELESKTAKAYQQRISEAIQSYRDRAKSGEVDEAAEALVTLGILRKIGSEFKVQATLELAQELLDNGEQVVIFTEFTEAVKVLHKELGGEMLTGETPVEQRQAIVDRFQSGESKVFIGTIRAGGVGLTLTKASNVILHDRPYTPGDAEQAEDRCHRIGQDSTVTAFWMQLGEVDSAIDQLLQQKAERIELVLKGKRKTLRGVGSINDLAKELLSTLI